MKSARAWFTRVQADLCRGGGGAPLLLRGTGGRSPLGSPLGSAGRTPAPAGPSGSNCSRTPLTRYILCLSASPCSTPHPQPPIVPALPKAPRRRAALSLRAGPALSLTLPAGLVLLGCTWVGHCLAEPPALHRPCPSPPPAVALAALQAPHTASCSLLPLRGSHSGGAAPCPLPAYGLATAVSPGGTVSVSPCPANQNNLLPLALMTPLAASQPPNQLSLHIL